MFICVYMFYVQPMLCVQFQTTPSVCCVLCVPTITTCIVTHLVITVSSQCYHCGMSNDVQHVITIIDSKCPHSVNRSRSALTVSYDIDVPSQCQWISTWLQPTCVTTVQTTMLSLWYVRRCTACDYHYRIELPSQCQSFSKCPHSVNRSRSALTMSIDLEMFATALTKSIDLDILSHHMYYCTRVIRCCIPHNHA